MAKEFHICQYNVARAIAPIDDPRMADFVHGLDKLYAVSDVLPGFVWRVKSEVGNTLSIRPYDDPQIMFGLSVWKTFNDLKEFVYGKAHAAYIRRRAEWFAAPDGPHIVLWWQRAGELPSIGEGDRRLHHLRNHGPSAYAFDFKTPFRPPVVRVGTLGPEGTNSEKAACEYLQRTGSDSELLLYDTFEEVVDQLLEGTLDKVVVCTAYLKFSALYFERVPQVRMSEVFVADLHPMVIATRPGFGRVGRSSFAVQPAILPLVRHNLDEGQIRPAASNASAAHDVAKGKVDACLTTEVAAQSCGLEIVSRMPPLQIPFVVFERASSEGSARQSRQVLRSISAEPDLSRATSAGDRLPY